MRYAMVVDTKLCYGCNACSVACKLNNNLPNKVWWNTVLTEGGATRDTAGGQFPDSLHMDFFPKHCMHCSNAPCAAVCPTSATKVREDGIVSIDQELCIGCGTCQNACPFDVRVLVKETPEYYSDYAVGQYDAPAHVVDTMEKCTFCANVVDRGGEPSCVAACMNAARFFGDLDDSESVVSKVLAGRETVMPFDKGEAMPNLIYLA